MIPTPPAERQARTAAKAEAPAKPEDAPQPALCELTLRVAGMSCAACQAQVQRALAAVPGVQDASVDLLANTAHVAAAASVDTQTLAAAVRRAGYDLVPLSAPAPASSGASTAPATEDFAEPGQRTLGLRVVFALLAGALAMLLSVPLMTTAATGAAGHAPLAGERLLPPYAGSQAAADATARAPQAALHERGLPPGNKPSLSLSDLVMRRTMAWVPAALLRTSANLLRWILLVLALATMLFAAPEIYRAAWRAARHRATNMNTLVALGTLVAFAVSAYTTVLFSIGRPSRNFSDVYFEAVVLILAFLLAGRWLEARARLRATASLRAFAHTETGNARWIGEGSPPELEADPDALLGAAETLLPLDAVAVGDLLHVLPGDRVPLDGVVLAGRSSVDESMLTGEPLPVTRSRGDRLFAGTLNLDGPLLLRATALGADSMQAQMARLLERARSTRAPLQRLADRVSAVFVPVVLTLAALTFLVWALADNTAGQHLGYGRALSLAIAVLVVACPCAMGLAVPAAIAVSLGTAARAGILIKGGEALERLATIDFVAFDKTGTLTEGKPQIVAFVPTPQTISPAYLPQQLLAYAAAVESASTHPLADAIRSHVADQNVPATRAIAQARILPGLGAEATVEGRPIVLGSAAVLTPDTSPPPPPPGLEHATPMYLLVGQQLQGTFYATDTLRPSAVPALADLARLHLTSTLLTGDTPEAAQALARDLGLQRVEARLLPADKLTAITTLQQQGHRVAMVGDGLNDAAALAHADAGIAMASGTDLAREAGHVLLLHHDLTLVPQAIRLARRTRRLMRQNLAWALLYNVLGIPLAAGVFVPHFGIALSPAFASAAMALSSVSVLLNSLRLAVGSSRAR